jgi:hypothetical protein
MYKVTDDFYTLAVFNRILELVRECPINQVPENYDGKRCSYGKVRQYLTEDSELVDLILSKFPYKNDYRRKIEIGNDVNGFWLKPHSDHSAKREVTVIYFEGQENNGTIFHYPHELKRVRFIPNRAVHFYPDLKDTYDTESWKHSVKKINMNIRRTVVVNYVDNTWRNIEDCYDR